MLQVRNIEKYYGSKNNVTKALDRVSFEVDDGEFIAIMGASGSGKTTLLNCISCYIPADSGSIRLGSQELARLDEDTLAAVRNKKLGFVFQDFLLLDGLTVRDNILLPRIIAGETGGDMEQAADRLCGIFGIGAIRDKYPAEISGGEKQRVSIARAILKDAPIVVLDEATAFADPENEALIQKAFAQLTKGRTVIMIAHRLSTITNADCIYVLADGKIAESGTHEELLAANGVYTHMWNEYNRSVNWQVGKTGAAQ